MTAELVVGIVSVVLLVVLHLQQEIRLKRQMNEVLDYIKREGGGSDG